MTETTALLQQLEQLKRIADALERLATSKEQEMLRG
jgi:hypothetical protein